MATCKFIRRLWINNHVICQNWSQIWPKRYLQTTVSYQCSAEKATDDQSREEERAAADEQAVLHFFNHCDYVTLKKFTGRCSQFRLNQPDEVLRRGTVSRRYRNIRDLLFNVRGPKKSDAIKLASIRIAELKESEENTLGIRLLDPQLTCEDVKDIEQVTAVEVFQNEIAWAVETRDRCIVNAGHVVLFPKFRYTFEHVSYQNRISEIINEIPASPIYLMSPPDTGKGDKFKSHQSIVLSLALLLLNMKPADNILNDPAFLNTSEKEMPNKVHMMNLAALQEYYDILFQGEVLKHAWDLNHWLDARSRPLAGLQLDANIKSKLTKAVGRQQMTKCVLITDMFFKSLYKNKDKFPRMYSRR